MRIAGGAEKPARPEQWLRFPDADNIRLLAGEVCAVRYTVACPGSAQTDPRRGSQDRTAGVERESHTECKTSVENLPSGDIQGDVDATARPREVILSPRLGLVPQAGLRCPNRRRNHARAYLYITRRP